MSKELIQKVWPEWKPVKELGRGTFGVVYEAVREDHNVVSRAAIKVITIPGSAAELSVLRSDGLDPDQTRSYLRGIVDEFVEEIRLMETMKGLQNIVSVEDFKVVERTDEVGWDILIRMELLTPFTEYVASHGALTQREIIKLGVDVCSALEVCGRRNIIHRDIKPDNIFVNDLGDFKLGDFGVARKLEGASSGLSVKGTSYFMAPEVLHGETYDARVDIYSLGLVLYRMANGMRMPFVENTQQAASPIDRRNAIERRMRGERLPAPSDASPELAEVILRACAYDPNRRFATATDLKAALNAVREGKYRLAGITPKPRNEYAAVENDDLERTTAVRRAPATGSRPRADSRPVSGSRPTSNSRPVSGSQPGTNPRQGTNPRPAGARQQEAQRASGRRGDDDVAPKRKKRVLPKLIAAVLVLALLGGGGFYAGSMLANRGRDDSAEPAQTENAGGETAQASGDAQQAAPEVTPTAAPEVTPTAAPEVTPTAAPEATPTAAPTEVPTAQPTVTPSANDPYGIVRSYRGALDDKGYRVFDMTITSCDGDGNVVAEVLIMNANVDSDNRWYSYRMFGKIDSTDEEGNIIVNIDRTERIFNPKGENELRPVLTISADRTTLTTNKGFSGVDSALLPPQPDFSYILRKYTGFYYKQGWFGMDIELRTINPDGSIEGEFSFYQIPYGAEIDFGKRYILCRAYRTEAGTTVLSVQAGDWIAEPRNKFDFNYLILEISADGTHINAPEHSYWISGIDASITEKYPYSTLVKKTFTGTYMPKAGVAMMDVKITSLDTKTGDIEAECAFYPHEHNPGTPSGKFKMHGGVVSVLADGSIRIYLVPDGWIQKPDDEEVSTFPLDLTVNPEFTLVTSGQNQIHLEG